VVEGRGAGQGEPARAKRVPDPEPEGASSALERVRQAAQKYRRQRFTALLHHVYDRDRLRRAYFALKRDPTAGIDGAPWQHYGERLEEEPPGPRPTLGRGAYRARPVRRAFILKADGRQFPCWKITLRNDQLAYASARRTSAAAYWECLGSIAEGDTSLPLSPAPALQSAVSSKRRYPSRVARSSHLRAL
jgi:hypothetical protein